MPSESVDISDNVHSLGIRSVLASSMSDLYLSSLEENLHLNMAPGPNNARLSSFCRNVSLLQGSLIQKCCRIQCLARMAASCPVRLTLHATDKVNIV